MLMADRMGSVEQWAREHNISRRAAYKRITDHQIPLRNGKLNFDEADRIWFASFQPSKQRGAVAGGAAAAAGRGEQADLFPDYPEEPNGAATQNPELEAIRGRLPTSALGRVQLIRDTAKANFERLRFEREQGKLVSLAEVTRFYSEVFSRVRDELSAVGAEIMDQLADANDPVECREIVDRRIEKALREIREWKPGVR